MKLASLLLLSIFGFAAGATISDGLAPAGKVICSLISPKTTGFELVHVRGKNKEYKGQYELEDLRIEATFWSHDYRLQLNISSLDQYGEAVEALANLETQMVPGQFVHLTTSHKGTKTELYCYFIKKTENEPNN